MRHFFLKRHAKLGYLRSNMRRKESNDMEHLFFLKPTCDRRSRPGPSDCISVKLKKPPQWIPPTVRCNSITSRISCLNYDAPPLVPGHPSVYANRLNLRKGETCCFSAGVAQSNTCLPLAVSAHVEESSLECMVLSVNTLILCIVV